MNPDVARAIPPLVEAGVLPAEQAAALLREARGELVSVHAELRALLYAGVLLLTGGVGLLIKENLERIGPLAIATGLALAAAAALGWVARVAPPFSWHEVTAPNLAFDYILLLGLLLAGADLAYCEVEWGPAGTLPSWHLLILAGLAGAAALRFDSRLAFSLSLSSLAAWRGVSLAAAGKALDLGPAAGVLRWNAIACGALFALLGFGLGRTGRKPHFEPVAVHLGWLLLLGGLAAGMARSSPAGPVWGVALLAVGAVLAAGAFRARRFPLFAYGLLAAYLGLTRLLLQLSLGLTAGCLWLAVSSSLLIAGLLFAHRRIKEADVKEADVKEADIKEADIKEADVKEEEIKKTQIKEAGTKEAEMKEPG